MMKLLDFVEVLGWTIAYILYVYNLMNFELAVWWPT